MNQCAVEILVKSVFDQPVKHTAGFDGHDEVHIVFEQFDFFFFNVVRNTVSRIAYVVACVDAHPLAPSISFSNGHVTDHSRTVLFRPQFEVLSQALRDDFEVFGEVVGFVLR